MACDADQTYTRGGKCKNPGYNNPVSKIYLYRVSLNLKKIFTNTVACTQTLFIFPFVLFENILCWWSINLLQFIFYHQHSTDFEERTEGL